MKRRNFGISKILNLDDIQNYSGFFDYIRFDQVLEHLDNVNDVLSVLKKISNPKCILFVSVPIVSQALKNRLDL